ncbi:MAG: hypothetical protein P8189_02200, partial [Anaerolineae bacterium]
MTVSGVSAGFESRIGRGLLWFLRAVLLLLLIGALLRGEFFRALALAGMLAVHGVIYWAASRVSPSAWRRWG